MIIVVFWLLSCRSAKFNFC